MGNIKDKMKCIGAGVLITLSFVIGVGVISSIAMMLMKNGTEHIALISGMAQAVYLLLAVLILKIRKIDIRETYGLKLLSCKAYVLPVTAAFCFSAFSNILQSVAPIPSVLTGGMSDDMEKSMVAFVLSIFLVAPVTEEFVFRGFIMTRLRRQIPAAVSVVISAFLFALIHAMAGGVITVAHAFFGGLIFALAYEKTKSLFVAVAAHIFGNIGGYVPVVTDALPDAAQYAASAAFLTATAAACAGICRKRQAL